MDTIAGWISDKDRIAELEKELYSITTKYNKLISKGLTVRSANAIKLLKKKRMTNEKIAEKVSLSLYHINRLSSELRRGLRD